MSISLNSDINAIAGRLQTQNASTVKADSVSAKLRNLDGASDEELMDACKSFESYLVEQVLNQVRESIVPEDEDEDNDYVKMFGDRLYQEYASTITESGELGLAQRLYEAMKREYGPRA